MKDKKEVFLRSATPEEIKTFSDINARKNAARILQGFLTENLVQVSKDHDNAWKEIIGDADLSKFSFEIRLGNIYRTPK